MIRTLFHSRRAFIALVFLMLTSCNTKASREWCFQANLTARPCYNGGRIFLEAEREYDYLEIEIVRSRSGIRFYLNILFLQAMPCLEDLTKAKVEVIFENEEEPWIIYSLILRGGQRLLLPTEVSNYLIQVLSEGQSFEFKVGNYHTKAIPETFEERYQALMKINIEENGLINQRETLLQSFRG